MSERNGETPPAGLAAALANDVRTTARHYAPDLYVAGLLAPRRDQPHLIALAAFLGDIERIVAGVSEPAIAEIRLQWWRDAIVGASTGTRTGNPTADALGEAIRARDLPFAVFDNLLDARALDLYADPLPDDAALFAYLNKTDGAAFELAARCLGAADPAGQPLIQHATVACGITRLICKQPVFLARGRAPFPGLDAIALQSDQAGLDPWYALARKHHQAARNVWSQSSRPERTACLPLALVQPYLSRAAQHGHSAARVVTDIEPLARMWRMWQAHAFGRI